MAMHLLNTYHQTHFNTEKKFGDEEISAVNIRDAMTYIDVPARIGHNYVGAFIGCNLVPNNVHP